MGDWAAAELAASSRAKNATKRLVTENLLMPTMGSLARRSRDCGCVASRPSGSGNCDMEMRARGNQFMNSKVRHDDLESRIKDQFPSLFIMFVSVLVGLALADLVAEARAR